MRLEIPPLFKNKYFLVLIAALVWFVFFDRNNLIQQYRLQRQLNEFREKVEYYEKEIESDSVDIQKLRNNPEELERYAREKYLMKKENEDIFIIKK